MTRRKDPESIVEAINHIAEDTNRILTECERSSYLHGIVMLYSFIENILKWLVFVKMLWDKAEREIGAGEAESLRASCKSLTFNNAISKARALGIADRSLSLRLDDIRKERNDIVHQFWLYTHRDNNVVLRKKLEKLARASNLLVEKFNSFTEDIGVDEVYEFML